MNEIQNLYITFLNNFPEHFRSLVSVVMAVLVVYAVYKVIKKDFIFIIVLVLLLPGSVPILQSVWQGVVALVKFLLNTK